MKLGVWQITFLVLYGGSLFLWCSDYSKGKITGRSLVVKIISVAIPIVIVALGGFFSE